MVPGSPEAPGCNATVQLTAVLELPVTVALNCCVELGLNDALVGLTVTETAAGVGVGVELGVELLEPPPPQEIVAKTRHSITAGIVSDSRKLILGLIFHSQNFSVIF